MVYSIYYFNKRKVEIREAISLVKVTANYDDIFYISDDLTWRIIDKLKIRGLDFKINNDFIGESCFLLDFLNFSIWLDESRIEIKIAILSEIKLNELSVVLNIINNILIHEFKMSGYDPQARLIFDEYFGYSDAISYIENEYNEKLKQSKKNHNPKTLLNFFASAFAIGCMTLIFTIIFALLYLFIRVFI